jgi:hypothetical protein
MALEDWNLEASEEFGQLIELRRLKACAFDDEKSCAGGECIGCALNMNTNRERERIERLREERAEEEYHERREAEKREAISKLALAMRGL